MSDEPETVNTIDYLMDLDPLELAKLEDGVSAMVVIMRQFRAKSQAGIKPKKESGPKVKLDFAALGLKAKPAEAPIKRRF